MYQNLIHFYNLKDFNVVVLQPDRDKKSEKKILKKDILTYYYKELNFFGNHFVNFIDFNPFFISKFLKVIKKHNIDLIHFDYVYGINILNLFFKKPICYNAYNVEAIYFNQVGKYFYKLPFFFRTFYVKYIYYLEKRAVRLISMINVLHKDDERYFKKLYHIPQEMFLINSYGYKKEIFENEISKETARKRLGIDRNKFVVIFHGSYSINAANREAIYYIYNKIAPNIKDENILFLLAGERPPLKDIKNLKFLGFIDNLNNFLYAADIAIAPIFRGAGIKVKIIDYLSAKLPLISTKQGILNLFFENNIHGYIVRKNNPISDMIEKIIYLKNNPDKINEFKKNIRNLMHDKYSWDEILNNLEKKYRMIIKEYNFKNSKYN